MPLRGRRPRAPGVEDRVERRLVADVAEDDVVGVEQGPPVDRELHGVQRRLVAVEHHQLGGLEAVDLAAQLGADRAAGAGHQHPTPGEIAGDRGDVGVELVATEHVGEVDVAEVADADVVVKQLGGSRQHLHGEACPHGRHPQPLDHLGRGAGQGQYHCARHRVGRACSPISCGRADHRHSADAQQPLARIVVEQGDRVPLVRLVAQHRADQLGARFAGANDQHPHGPVVPAPLVVPLSPAAPHRARPRDERPALPTWRRPAPSGAPSG